MPSLLPTMRWLLAASLLLGLPAVGLAEPRVEVCEKAVSWGMAGGRDGWVFNAADLRTDFTMPPAARAGLERLMRTLASHGPEVVALYWPLRPMTVPEVLDPPDGGKSIYDVQRAVAGYYALGKWMKSTGIAVVDLLPVARSVTGRESFYLRRDHHPTPSGTRAVAAAAAVTLGSHPAWSSVPTRRFEGRPVERVKPPEEGRGESLERACGVVVEPQSFLRYETFPVEEAGGGLLDEAAEPEIVVVGTSNLSWTYNLVGFLEETASAEALPVLTQKGGVLGSLQAYLRSPDYQRHRPAFLVWEFALYELFREHLDGAPDPMDPAVYRQIIPSVYGACDPAAAVLAGGAALGPVDLPLLAAPRRKPIPTSGHYLFLETDDPGLLTFDIVTRHADDSVDTYAVVAATRLRTYGRYFLEFVDGAPVRSVSLRVPPGRAGKVSARICRVPPSEPAP